MAQPASQQAGGPSARREVDTGGGWTGAALSLLWQRDLHAQGSPPTPARWWLAFGWQPGRLAGPIEPQVRRVRVEGVTPALLWRVRLSVGGVGALDLPALNDGRGGMLSAGELMASMGVITGHEGLTLALPTGDARAVAPDVLVQLWLLSPQPDCSVLLLPA